MRSLFLLSLMLGLLQSVCERSANSTATASPNSSTPVASKQENKMNDINENVQRVLQLTLDLPKLQPYLHPESPNRKPMHVIANDQVGDVKLEKFGEPVKFISAADAKAKNIPAFEFTSVDVDKNSATVGFRYRVEGIRGKVSFKFTDKWEVVSSELNET